MALRAITTVYSYRHPETRKAVDDLLRKGFPHRMFLSATNPPGALDNFHEPVIERALDFYRDDVPQLRGFPHRYPTAGSEEGIREVMTQLQTSGEERIYMWRGDYEGYREVAKQRGLETVEIDQETDPRSLTTGYWFLSNPSARDGNIVPDKAIQAVCEAGHQVFYDLAYLGSTPRHVFDVSHPNIFAVVLSMSKTYGMFYDRVGFTFARQPVDSLYGNKWFKGILGLMIAKAVLGELQPGQLAQKYKAVQAAIVAAINAEFGLGMKPSDTFLLGHITAADAARLRPEQLTMIERFKRGSNYRFCLTPYFVEQDPEAKILC